MFKRNSFQIVLILFLFISAISCTKEEGKGGVASITGVVKIQNIDYFLKNVGSAAIAKDFDVYIKYGDSENVSDKIETSDEGVFTFNYLTPGDYTVYVFSDDTTVYKAQYEITINKMLTISDKKETIDLGEIMVYKQLEVNDGVAQVCGNVREINYINGTKFPLDTIAAQDKDLYLMYGDTTFFELKTATHYDGSFCFTNLIPGKYKVYTLSEQLLSTEDIPVFMTFEITDSTKSIQLAPVYISNY
ncbi:MAG: hypothetical protein IPO21_20995 [Bacteroidales bacterium]|nr:hypothetical protein [Bacteroidales bacterium]